MNARKRLKRVKRELEEALSWEKVAQEACFRLSEENQVLRRIILKLKRRRKNE